MNPVRVLAEQFVRQSPMTLLVYSIVVSLADFAVLYGAARHEGVLHIEQGVGLLNNYGLLSTLLGNMIFLYAAKKYYNFICSMRASDAVIDIVPVKESLVALKDKIEMQREYQFGVYLLIVIGALFWLNNFSVHVSGDPVATWGHKVFDSKDHMLSFIASRFHNIYTWMIIYPFLTHIMIYSSIQLRRAITKAMRRGALTYDLLNPDQRGGFAFVDKAAITFNAIVAIVYIQITLHVETFKMNPEHIIIIVLLTLAAVLIDKMFLGSIYALIKTLRLEALNKVKDKVYKDDEMSFEILKYCYERRVSFSSIVNFAINPGAIVISGLVKIWPAIAKAFS